MLHLIDARLAKHLKNNTTMWFVSASLDSAKPETHDHFRVSKELFSQQ